LSLVESKQDISETLNNYLENAQSSVKLPAGSVSPVSIIVKYKHLITINNTTNNIHKY